MEQSASLKQLSAISSQTPGLRLLLLVGSRATQTARADSDWDFAWLGNASLHVDLLCGQLSIAVRSDHIDMVDLQHAGPLMRFRAAREGVVLFAATPDDYEDFVIEASQFWCDMGPVIQQASADYLQEFSTHRK